MVAVRTYAHVIAGLLLQSRNFAAAREASAHQEATFAEISSSATGSISASNPHADFVARTTSAPRAATTATTSPAHPSQHTRLVSSSFSKTTSTSPLPSRATSVYGSSDHQRTSISD
eukprot:CAMPEP_0183589832 /NCGR_PEP_ID=MMETSP0371-20130417/163440_1 /TAXON_ID=268820 /ORGANISM="Peridinium aciculiferum, Strain PAER-2" /LENGTH=116 /DNA_ID=CAMNT_0025801177 /DNA_START=1 /DNA_END=348 /DNA_ORIENTATION=+